MKRLVVTWIALVAIALTSFAASRAHVGGTPLALALAIAKAALVGAVFMDLARERASVRFAAATGFALVVVFVLLAAADPATR